MNYDEVEERIEVAYNLEESPAIHLAVVWLIRIQYIVRC